MKTRWKLLGLASVAGVAATGAVVARKTRIQSDLEPDEIRDRLRRRLADAQSDGDGAAPAAGGPAPATE
jgi:2-phosphoglycerate kinase